MRRPRIIVAFSTALLLVLVLASLCAGVALIAELVLPDWVLDRMIHMLLVPVLFVAAGVAYPRLRGRLNSRRRRAALLLPGIALYLMGGYTLFEMVGLPGVAWPFAALPLLGLLRLCVALLRQDARRPKRAAAAAPMITLPRSHIAQPSS
jgi:peptidoglycan/LPS O-acetylase OafA/YrhL